MPRFKVEVYGRHKLESGEYGRCKVKEFSLNIWPIGSRCPKLNKSEYTRQFTNLLDGTWEITTREVYTPITQQDRNVASQVYDEYTTILTERFIHRPFTEYRITLES